MKNIPPVIDNKKIRKKETSETANEVSPARPTRENIKI